MSNLHDRSFGGFLNSITPGSARRALSAYLTFLAAAQVGTIGISLTPIAVSQAIAILILTASICTGIAVWILGGGSESSDGKSAASAPPPRWIRRAIAALCAFFAFLVVVSILQPDWSTDGNVYHIPVMHFWTLEGRVHWIPHNFHDEIYARMNGFPKAVETMAFLLVNATGLTQLANLGNLLFLPLGIMGIACLSLGFGASPPAAVLCGLLFVAVPMNISQAPTTYVDTACASAVIALFALAVKAAAELRRGPASFGLALALGAAIGLAAGAKTTGLSIALIFSLALMALALAPPPVGTNRQTILIRTVSCLAVAGLAAAVVGGYWYLRNFLHTGSPVFPVGVTIGNAVLFPGLDLEDALKIRENLPEILRDWPMPMQVAYCWLQGLNHWPKSIIGVDARLGGLGFLWVMACLPSIGIVAWGFFRGPRVNGGGLFAALLAAVCIALLICPMNCVGRYTLWLYGLGLPCFAVVISRQNAGTLPGLPWRVWMAGCLAVCLLEAAICSAWSASYVYPGGWRAIVQAPGDVLRPENWRYPANYLFPQFDEGPAAALFDCGLSVAIGPIKTDSPGGPGKARILGRLSRPIGEREILSLGPIPDSREIRDLRAMGIRCILWDDNVPIPPSMASEAALMQSGEKKFIFFLLAIPLKSVPLCRQSG